MSLPITSHFPVHIIGAGPGAPDLITVRGQTLLAAADTVFYTGSLVPKQMLQWCQSAETIDTRSHTLETWLPLLKERVNQGKRVVRLQDGDPCLYGALHELTAFLLKHQMPFEIVPGVSAFQLAAARMGWSLADLETLTVHGRPVEQMIAFIQPLARLLILTTGSDTPDQIAKFLTDRGFGRSPMTVLSEMGGPNEARFDGVAENWDHEVPPFNTLAVDCVADPQAALLPRVPGLADHLFSHDGTMTKQEVRAVTLAKLMPMRGALLWDIGTGCGSVAVEWMRGARYARAIGIEPRADRRAMAAENALALGVPRLELIDGVVPEALEGLEAPDAVFIGGGLSPEVFDAAWAALRPLGRLVCNAVTLESEAILLDLHKAHGGDLVKLSVARADPVGDLTGWRPMMPVTQWSLIKR